MALTIAYLGEKLRKISKRARMSIASLSAYLNEVPSVPFTSNLLCLNLCFGCHFGWVSHYSHLLMTHDNLSKFLKRHFSLFCVYLLLSFLPA